MLVGDPARAVRRVMTCLTVTPASADEATHENVDLIISHHPLPFRPLKRVTTDSVPGRLLWQLIRGGISEFSANRSVTIVCATFICSSLNVSSIVILLFLTGYFGPGHIPSALRSGASCSRVAPVMNKP